MNKRTIITNKDLVDLYVSRGKKKELLINFLSVNIGGSEAEILMIVDKWIKTFNYQWKQCSCLARLYERKSSWLDSTLNTTVSTQPSSKKQERKSKLVPKQMRRQSRYPVSDNKISSGPKRKAYATLSRRTQENQCRQMAKKEAYEKILRSAEKVARSNGKFASAKILKSLRVENEVWATETMKFVNRLKKNSIKALPNDSIEKSFALKTRLGLSKRKYNGIAKYAKERLGVQLLEPWAKVIEYRDQIIPKFSSPNWDKGYLSASVTVRDLVTTDVTRLLELEDVATKVANAKATGNNDGFLECLFYVSGGVDSATGFQHYNQSDLLGKDDSLLSEHFMSLLLMTKDGHVLWKNPNPQSDTICRVRSMNWTKETDILSRQMFTEFYEEIDLLNEDPVVLKSGDDQLRIRVSGVYSMIDGKVANAIVNNRDTHACPLCVKNCDLRIGPSFFHSKLNAVEWLIRYAAKKAIDGHPALTHPEVKAKIRSISNDLESHFKMNINRPKIGGSGSSNNGNTARRLLDEPDVFANILGISIDLTSTLRLISSLALSSRKLDHLKVDVLYNTLEQLIRQEFPFARQLPPCLHKYKHLGEISQRMPYTMNFIDEQAGERCHKKYKNNRLNLSRKTSAVDNLSDMMKSALAWSDPKISCLDQSNNPQRRQYKDQQFNLRMNDFFIDEDNCSDTIIIEEFDDDVSSAESENSLSDSEDGSS